MAAERIQKLLATAGLGSRREIERWIEAGRITLNGEVAKLGDRSGPGDKLTLDGAPVKIANFRTPIRVLLYNKPEGEIVARKDPEGRDIVFDQLPELSVGRWIAVGRLDLNTSGLLLFTNHGELARRLMHPSYALPREYVVRVFGQVDEAMLERLRQGVQLEDGLAKFSSVTLNPGQVDPNAIVDEEEGQAYTNNWYTCVLTEGRNREVRRLWESQGLRVSRLIRSRFGAVRLGRETWHGQHRELSPREVAALLREVQLTDEAERITGSAQGSGAKGASATSKYNSRVYGRGPKPAAAGPGKARSGQPKPTRRRS